MATMMIQGDRNEGDSWKSDSDHEERTRRDTPWGTNQVPAIYGDAYKQNINIFRELIFVNKNSRGGSDIPNSRDSLLLDESL